MRIKKTSQYINGGASLSNVYGTSQSNGYSQEYLNGQTYTLTPSYTYAPSTYQLFKIGKAVTLTTGNIWTDKNYTSQTWKEIATLPNEICPKTEISFDGVAVSGDSGNVLTSCKVLITTAGVIKVKTPSNLTDNTAIGINFSVTYLTN